MISRKAILLVNVIVLLLTLLVTFEGSLYSSSAPSFSSVSTRSASQDASEPEEDPVSDFLQEMSLEFGMGLEMVETVDRLAREYVDSRKPEWRLIQTPEFMTHIMLSLIHAESNGNPDALGDGGRAVGLTQIWLTTAQQYGSVSRDQLLEPDINLKFAFRHFHYLLKRYRGNLALALYSWNRGQGTVDRLIRYGEPPNNNFGPKVYRASVTAGETNRHSD